MAKSWQITDGTVTIFVQSAPPPRPGAGTLRTGTVLSTDTGGFYLQELSGDVWFCAWQNLYWIQKAA